MKKHVFSLQVYKHALREIRIFCEVPYDVLKIHVAYIALMSHRHKIGADATLTT